MTTMNAVGTDLTLDQIKDTINGLLQQGNTGAHQIGTLYNHVVDKRLAIIAGYKDTRTYFAQNVKALSQSALSVYGRVAKLFPETSCTLYGPYKLNALYIYAELTGMGFAPDPANFLIDVPQDNGTMAHKPFAECSVDEIERATKAKRTPPKVNVPVGDQARMLFLADSINKSFAGVADVRLSTRNKEGKTLISLQDVPLTEVQRLMLALQQGMSAEPTDGMSM